MKAFFTLALLIVTSVNLPAENTAVADASSSLCIAQKVPKLSFWQRATLKMASRKLAHMVSAGPKCAVILKKDGTEMMVRIISKNNRKITYKLCDQPAAASRTIAADSVEVVRLADDWIWMPRSSRDGIDGKNKMGNWSLILGVLAWLTAGLGVGFLLAIVSIGLGVTSIRHKYKRRQEAIIGIVLSASLLLLVTAALLILFSLFGDL